MEANHSESPPDEPAEAQNIIVLSDGTGNSAAQVWRTNVWRVYQSLDLRTLQQVAYYNDGVGTSTFRPLAMLGGAFGWGLKRNVIDLYTAICRTYDPGDRIYAFGFSRGAYTIRVVVDLVANRGILAGYRSETELRQLARDAYRVYRRGYQPGSAIGRVLVALGRSLRDTFLWCLRTVRGHRHYDDAFVGAKPDISFVGLWDTVAAYGMPVEEMARGIDYWYFPLSLPNRRLSDKVNRACHALSIDDARTTFHPMLWTEDGERVFPAGGISRIENERISQVWFAGAHANVGGGYPDDGLSFVALDWIMTEAGKCGLKFDAEKLRDNAWRDIGKAQNFRGRLYNSRRGLASYYRYGPRRIEELIDAHRGTRDEVIISIPKVHHSVFDRIMAGIDAYAPINLPEHYAVVNADGTVTENTYEQPAQASRRRNEQEAIWNRVWLRSIIYGGKVALSLFLAAFPLIFAKPDGAACTDPFCALRPAITTLGMVLPGFMSPWTTSFAANPGPFTFVTIVLAMLIAAGLWMELEITSNMRRIWERRLLAAAPVAPPAAPIKETRFQILFRALAGVRKRGLSGLRSGLRYLAITTLRMRPKALLMTARRGGIPYLVRSHRLYRSLVRWIKRFAAPHLFALLFFVAGLVVLNRALIATGSALGLICNDVTASRDRLFSTSDLCWLSPFEVYGGESYRITLTAEQRGIDGSINSGLSGYRPSEATDLASYLAALAAIPIRRSISHSWLQPIARIGATGDDEYPLVPEHRVGRDSLRTRLTAVIKARSDGKLFLFVNDAIIGWPGAAGLFYRDNVGQATVTLEPFREPAMNTDPAER